MQGYMKNKLIVHGLVMVNGKYLVIKRNRIKRGAVNVYPQFWDIPGGSVELGELPREALLREVQEEVGIIVKIKEIIHEDSNFDNEKNAIFVRLVYTCDIEEDSANMIILDGEEHSEYRLIQTLADLAGEDVVPYLNEILSEDTF